MESETNDGQTEPKLVPVEDWEEKLLEEIGSYNDEAKITLKRVSSLLAHFPHRLSFSVLQDIQEGFVEVRLKLSKAPPTKRFSDR